MKALTNCDKCRKKIFKVYQQEFLKEQYAAFENVKDTIAEGCTAVMLMAMIRKGRSKKYIQDLFNDIVMIYDSPGLFGKDIRSDEIIERLEQEYELDFSRIHIHIESESQFMKENKK